MILQSCEKPDLLLPDMTFWKMTINQPVTEIYKNYKVLCPTISYAEIYNDPKGANKRFEDPFEVHYITPWIFLVRNELEGQPIFQDGNIAPIYLKSEKDMDENEKKNVESAKKMLETFDAEDSFLSAQPPASRGVRNKAFVSFANASYRNLTWEQFIEKFKKVSKGTLLESIARIAEMPTTDRNRARRAIENGMSEYAKMYPINNFEKAFAWSKSMLEDNFFGICNDIFIPMLEEHLEFDRTRWNNTRDQPTHSSIRDSFPYTWYALYHYIAFHVYQNENTHTPKIGSRDFEYLYYLYFRNVLFVSADDQHEKYITGAGIVKKRHNGSFAYIPHKNKDPDEHDRVMKYIKEGVLY